MTNTAKDKWYHFGNIDKIDSPALVVYSDRVKNNIRLLQSMIDDIGRLRPHVKTHKTIEGTQLLMEAGINKFKCATIAEGEMLALAGAGDVLLAYQPVGPKIERFFQLIKKCPKTKFSCLIDDFSAADALSKAAIENDLVQEVYVDINAGMNRTGIIPDMHALKLYQKCAELEGLKVKGLHIYDGHFKDPDLEKRKSACDAAFHEVTKLKKAIMVKGLDEPDIIAGGSTTFPIHAQRKGVECSPGTFIFWDRGYQLSLPEQPFLPAAFVLTRVVSLPSKKMVCLDLGHKSIASENTLENRVYFPDASDLKFVGQSEEHLMLEAPEGHSYKVGDVLFGIPYHICPTCALYERVVVVEGKKVKGEWEVMARDRKITI